MVVAYLNFEDLSKASGGKVHFWAIATELLKLGLRVAVIAPKYSRAEWKLPPQAANLQLIPVWVPGKNAIGLLWFESALFIVLLRLRFRGCKAVLVRGGGASFFLALTFLLARLMGIRVVLECNGVPWAEYQSRGYGVLFCNFVLFSAWLQAITSSAIIGVTPAIRNEYCRIAHRPSLKGYAISNGVFTESIPLERRAELRRARGWLPDQTICVMPSEFTPWHGIRELIDAIALLTPEERCRLRFILPGSGEIFDQVADAVRRQSLASVVELSGRLDRNEIYELLAAADVGFFLCADPNKLRYPGSPLKLFEYLGAGLQVITCNDSYHGQLIPHYGIGMVIPKTVPQEIANAIRTILRQRQDPDLRKRVRQIAEKEFHWRTVASRVAAVIKGSEPSTERWIVNSSASSVNKD